jgi:PAS domain S-box-containing protein
MPGKRDAGFEELVEDLNAIVWEAEADTLRFTYVSKGAERVLGYPISRWLSEEDFWAGIVHPEDREWAVDHCKRLIAEGKDHEFRYRAVHAHGHAIWLRDHVRVIQRSGGRSPVVRGVMMDITDELRREQELRESEERFRAQYESLPIAAYTWRHTDDDDFILMDANEAAKEQMRHKIHQALGGRASDLFEPRPQVIRDLTKCFETKRTVNREMRTRGRLTDGELYLSIHYVFTPPDYVIMHTIDLTQRRRNEELLAGQAEILEMISRGEPLERTLDTITLLVERHCDGALCSILLYDPQTNTLTHGAAPNLPEDYVRAIDGIVAGPDVGSCGTAAYEARLVVAEDVASDPRWKDFRHLALPQGLRACWSTPIFASDGNGVLGTFAMYYREPRAPSENDLKLLDVPTHLATIAIERSRSEMALRDREALLRDVTENIQEVFWIREAVSGRFLYISSAYESIFGRPVEELYRDPLSWLAAVHPHDLERVQARREEPITAEGEQEYRIVRPDGSVRWINVRVFPIRNEDGEVVRIAGDSEDVTARKQAELALLQSTERLQGIMDHSPALIYVKDRAGRHIMVNRTFLTCLGFKEEDVIGKADYEIFPPEQAEMFRRNDLQVLRTMTPLSEEATLDLEDGTHTFISVKFPLFNGAPEPYAVCGLATDITDNKALEEQLRQAQKMEAVGQLAGGVAHDFNNLLGVILNYANFVIDEASDEEAVKRDTSEIVQAARRAAALTHQLLVFSRRQVVTAVTLDLNAVIDDVQRLLARTLGEHILLRVNLEAGLAPIKADRLQIEQVLLNLAVNARDAMPTGGTLSISTANEDDSGRPDRVLLTVSDTGHGMSQEVRRRALEPFFTTKPMGQGTGMGLSTAYGIVTQAGGSIDIASEEGGGTTISILFPASMEEFEEEPGFEEVRAVDGVGTVLLVEDEEGIRVATKRILAGAGYSVIDTAGSAEALMAFELRDSPIDLLLTDVVLPQMSGIELAREIKSLNRDLRVLYMSGYPQEVIDSQGELDGPLLEKPFGPGKLLRTIQSVLGARHQ